MRRNRLGIFVIYSAQGSVEKYISYLLDGMNGLFKRLIIVVNGKLKKTEADKLRPYSQDIIYRKNYGFDGGAYKEVITKYLTADELKEYDQCVLFNDTFCGCFYDWNALFLRMEEEKKDFWGLSKWIGGYSQLLKENLPEHVQTFFVVVEEGILHNELFMKFWIDMEIPKSYEDAIKRFEVGFTQYFYKNGFQYLTWLDVMGGKSLLHMDEVVYLSYAGELIDRYSFPVLKKKACAVANMEQIIKIKEYLSNLYIDDDKIFYEFIDTELKKSEYFSIDEMQNFYAYHRNVYVYGNGTYAKLLKLYFKYKQWKIKDVIVTEKREGEEAIAYKDVIFNNCDGVIIAVSKKYNKEICDTICRDWKNIDILSFVKE